MKKIRPAITTYYLINKDEYHYDLGEPIYDINHFADMERCQVLAIHQDNNKPIHIMALNLEKNGECCWCNSTGEADDGFGMRTCWLCKGEKKGFNLGIPPIWISVPRTVNKM